MNRRGFLKGAAALGAGALAAGEDAGAAEAHVALRPAEDGPVISPHIYGHFLEHLGGVIYDGVWVGPDSRIPNIGGLRRSLVEDLKRIGAPNLRWPGGCFADQYHWRDGIGPRERRPRTYNSWQGRVPEGVDHTETNAFGTHEFMRLCRRVGAEPYVTANVRSGTAQEFHDWASYCNAPVGTVSLASERAANGDREPFGVRYWAVGNESWGCGGSIAADEYMSLYSRFVTQFPSPYGEPFFVAVGPKAQADDWGLTWTRDFFAALQRWVGGVPRGRRVPVHGFGLHFYTIHRRTGGRADAVTPETWYGVLREGRRLEEAIERHWQAMEEHDPEHRVKLVIDEWGAWHQPGSEIKPAYIFSQTGTLRDAVHAAVSLDLMNRHADKIEMANLAQTVNAIHSLFLADGERYARTPTYHVFEMYRPHMGARLVPMEIRVPTVGFSVRGERASLPGLMGSASRKGRRFTVSLVNPSLESSVVARISVAEAEIREIRGRILTHDDPGAANTFHSPGRVVPADLTAHVSRGVGRAVIPRQSVVVLELDLA